MSRLGIYLTFLAGVAAQFFYLSASPEEMAIHFTHGGYPDGWASSQTNAVISILVLAINSLIFLSVPFIFKHVPEKYISFPKKEFWLAAERKEQSIKIASNWIAVMGLATNAFLLLVFHLVYLANLKHPPRLDEELITQVFADIPQDDASH